MAKNNNLTDFLTGIATNLRSKLGVSDKINPQDFESAIDTVTALAEQKGEKSAYDTFWDDYQGNGERIDYTCGFAGEGWTSENFKPKYDIVIDGSVSQSGRIFYRCYNLNTSVKKALEDCGVKLIFKNIGNANKLQNFLYDTPITEMPVIDFSSITEGILGASYIGYNNNLVTIEKFIFPDSPNVTNKSDLFYACRALENITFGGTCYFSIDFSSSPLSGDSVASLLECLDRTDSENSRTVTIKKASKADYDEKYGDWDAKVAELSAYSWTISLY